MPDQVLTCVDCKGSFTFTERDQEFYASQNPPFSPPKRCKPCRQKKKEQRDHKTSSNEHSSADQQPRWTNGSESERGDHRPRRNRRSDNRHRPDDY